MAQFYTPRRKAAQPTQAMTLTIDNLDAFGQGVARLNGKTYFVTDALPGETVTLKITEDNRKYAKGLAVKRANDSSERVAPVCPHFGVCGGCQQQHISARLQRTSKSAALSHLFSKEIGVPVVISEPLFADDYHYRRRARLGLQFQRKQRHLQMGFRQAGSNDLVEIKQCPVLRSELEELIEPLRLCLSTLSIVAQLGHVDLVLADNGPLLVLRHLAPLNDRDVQSLLSFAQIQQVTVYLLDNEGQLLKLTGSDPYYLLEQPPELKQLAEIKPLRLQFEPQGFIQVNGRLNQMMVAQALSWLDIQPQDRVLDLFCGIGNFTLPIAQRAASVVGVEGVVQLVEQGQNNAQHNGLCNVQFYHANLADNSDKRWLAEGFDKILLDPARAGAQEIMPEIVKLAAKRVVYVSCNPVTLARDSKILLDSGYSLAELRMLDMFPQTGHLESMALFIKANLIKN